MSINSAKSSDLLTTSGLIATGKNYLKGVKILTDGTNAATVIVYDNTTNSGKVLYKGVVAGDQLAGPLDDFTHMVQAELGLYVVLSGTGANAVVYFG